jgi:hypothetical protein
MCLGCDRDHLYKDFPHKGDQMKNVNNIEEFYTMDDVDKRIPRIYVALGNRQSNYWSHMIEVEGKIYNQTIDVLIDFGAIHSYMDTNIV